MLQRIHRREEGVYQSLVTDLGLYDPLQTRQPRFQHGRKQRKTDIFCILCRSSHIHEDCAVNRPHGAADFRKQDRSQLV